MAFSKAKMLGEIASMEGQEMVAITVNAVLVFGGSRESVDSSKGEVPKPKSNFL
jgi:hypothetical protein